LAQLHLAAQEGRVQTIAGFGPKTQQALLEATAARLREERRFPLGVAEETATALLAGLAAVPGVARAVAAGSLRRRRETVGDLDLLVSLSGDSAVMERFIHSEEVRQVLLHGGTRASVVLKSGLQVDLRAVPAQSFGAAWVYFTGSKAHNIALRRLAQEQGLKVNEYGVFRGVERIAGATEASLYQALGLRYVEPELREDRGEIEAARQDRLPLLVTLADLRGDLHLHTRDSDGQGSLEAMAAAARARGWRYAAVTDHSRSPAFARGLDPVRLAKQIDRIDRFNEKAQGFTMLKGIEVDILQDGTLELPDSILQRLDLVVGAVHHHLDLPRAQQTERVLRAMDSRYFTLLAHPTGRLIGERAPCEIDLLRVLRKARERGCFVELNAQPARLDLADTACQMAKAEGVLVSINSDAHGTLEFNHLPSGIDQGRRGWLEKADVLNTRDLPELRPLLARTMG
jgi:DNA polymerase (family 10)